MEVESVPRQIVQASKARSKLPTRTKTIGSLQEAKIAQHTHRKIPTIWRMSRQETTSSNFMENMVRIALSNSSTVTGNSPLAVGFIQIIRIAIPQNMLFGIVCKLVEYIVKQFLKPTNPHIL